MRYINGYTLMLPDFRKLSQKGYISLVLIVFALLISALIFPFKFPVKNYTQSDGFFYCREFVSDAEAEANKIDVLTEVDTGDDKETQNITYKLIKKDVPIKPDKFKVNHHVATGEKIEIGGNKFQILFPKSVFSYKFKTTSGEEDIKFKDYGLIFLVYLTDSGDPVTVDVNGENLEKMDIYQDVTKPPISALVQIKNCVDEGVEAVTDPSVIVPDQAVSEDKEQLQLEWFLIKQSKSFGKSWWIPACKPALYLYPPKKQLVNVKIYPSGFLTYVDPPYDEDKGWTVWAEPDGKIQDFRFKIYDYLYFESKVPDKIIRKPTTGWVRKYDELEALYNEILPKLGLNEKQTQDFIDYWKKALPEAPYYFVGIIDKDNVNEIEKLEITPKPDSINRVRVYFERLDSWKPVEAPELTMDHEPITNNQFNVVEWGGMVKNDPNHPFTCSQ